MSTHLKAPSSPTPPDDQPEVEKKKILDLSLTQIAGGALAAMTAAALGSTLGVGGTIAGAALASVVAGVAGSLYTASLRTGRDKVRTVFRAPNDAASAPPTAVEGVPTISDAATRAATRTHADDTRYYQPTSDETTVLPAWDEASLRGHATPAASGGIQTGGAGSRGGKKSSEKRSRGSFPWKRAVAVSLSIFALAAVLITGYERVSGQPLSGGTGTTVSQLSNDSTKSDDDTKSTPSARSSSATPSASSSASSSTGVGDQPSASASAQSPSASASESPSTATPSASGLGTS